MNTQSKMLALTACVLCAGSARAQPASAPGALPAEPQHTAKITGRVVDENGQPVVGLGVRAVISSADFARLTMPLWTPIKPKGTTGAIGYAYEGPPPEDVIGRNMVNAVAVTRPDGTYTFNGLTTGHYYLMDGGNLNPGKVTSPASVDGREGETVQAPDIVVSRGALLRGQIVDKETGAPLPGLVLSYFDAVHPPDSEWLFASARTGQRELITDANGRFEIKVAPGDATFSIVGLGWTFDVSKIALSPQQQQRVQSSVPGSTHSELPGVKSGQNFYASDVFVEVSDDGAPFRQLAQRQWTRTHVSPNREKTLLFRLQKLVFKDGKQPRVPMLSRGYEGDPRK